MPTTHVEPGCDPLLQDIANTLWKSRKVVVITGAGISTNSGIPDFRSENGLYSLIQAQFDAAQRQGASTNSDADVSDVSIDPRPTKRRRRTYDESGLPGKEVNEAHEIPFPGLRNAVTKPAETERAENNVQGSETLGERGSDARNNGNQTLPVPEIAAPFPSSPPSIALGTPRAHHRAHLLDSLPGSSSPLSSPPPVTFDPYQTSSSPSSEDAESSQSESEGPSSVTTPLLSSQTSFASSRTSLPMMKGRDLFDAQIWACPVKTSVFYTFASTLREKVRTAEPTASHRFVSVLRDSMKLVRCYTQNIDQLEERVGLSTSLSLGAGNRYRFSVRAGRGAGATKGAAKGVEGAPESGQGASQQGGEQQSSSEPQQKSQPGKAAGDEAASGADVPSSTAGAQASQPSDPSSSSDDAPSSTPASTAPTPPNRGVECVFLHGSLAELRCFVCAKTASWEEDSRLADTLAGRQPTCPHCAGATAARQERGKRALGVGKLRPDIVLYGEDHPHSHLISPLVQHDLSLSPDMLLILGTSMRVHGLKVLVREFAKAVHDRGGKVVFVNFTKPPESVWSDIIDYWVQWDCDAWVSDLQTRKPALWLPPGTVPPEEEKRIAKLSRKQSGVEPAKRKDGTEKTTRMKREESTLSVEDGQQTERACKEEMPPPQKPVRKKPIKIPREPKLNPDAKRPASIRDHKLNGAYLTWKIMEDLRHITGGGPAQSVAPSPNPTPAKPKAKRPRKSAPASLGQRSTFSSAVDVHATPLRQEYAGVPAPWGPPDAQFPRTGHSSMVEGDHSISAAVKGRKRKQTVAWRMINGVETRVSLNDAVEQPPRASPLPYTPAVLQPPPMPESRRLPPPTPTKPQSPLAFHTQNYIPQPQSGRTDQPHFALRPGTSTLPSPIHTIPPPTVPLHPANPSPRPPPLGVTHSPPAPLNDPIDSIDAGFRETDRLIEELSRPSTPVPVRLPPLKNIPERTQALHHHHNHQRPRHQDLQQQGQLYSPHHVQQQPPPQPKLVPLEPKVISPGPRKSISSNVGSPVSPPFASSPFFFADPLVGLLRYPPAWAQGRPEFSPHAAGQEEGRYSPPGQLLYSRGEARGGQGRQSEHVLRTGQGLGLELGQGVQPGHADGNEHAHGQEQEKWYSPPQHSLYQPGEFLSHGPPEQLREAPAHGQYGPQGKNHEQGPGVDLGLGLRFNDARNLTVDLGSVRKQEQRLSANDVWRKEQGQRGEGDGENEYETDRQARDRKSDSWCPDAQLRKEEEEAALLLSAMSGGRGRY